MLPTNQMSFRTTFDKLLIVKMKKTRFPKLRLTASNIPPFLHSPLWSLTVEPAPPRQGSKVVTPTMDTIARSEFTFNLPVMPVRHLACPARFERATYGLEGAKIYLEQ
jgi:hypothetical protein